MSQIKRTAQSLDPGAIVSLFQIDTRKVGGDVHHFVQSRDVGENISFGGVEYTSIDIEFDGLETSGQGALPSPTLRLANTDGWAQLAVNTFGDLLGCKVLRVRTFAKHLDGHEEEDDTAFFKPDIFLVERKTEESPEAIEWELSAAIDQEGKQLPGRPVLRNTCIARYRTYLNNGTFSYDKVQCPYTDNRYFDEQDKPTTIDKDRPSRTLTCCEKRFGKGNPLPFWGFPGVGRAA